MKRAIAILSIFLAGMAFSAAAELWVRLWGCRFGLSGGRADLWLALFMLVSASAAWLLARRADRAAVILPCGAIGAAAGILGLGPVLRMIGVYPTAAVVVLLGFGAGIAAWRLTGAGAGEHDKPEKEPAKDEIHPMMAPALAAVASFLFFAFGQTYGLLASFVAADNPSVRIARIALLMVGFGLGAWFSNRRFSRASSPLAAAAVSFFLMGCAMWVSLIGLTRTARDSSLFQREGMAIVALTLIPTALLFGYGLILLLREFGKKKGGRAGTLIAVTAAAGAAGLLASLIQIPVLGALRGIFWTGSLTALFFLVVRHWMAPNPGRTALLMLPALILAPAALMVSGSAFVPQIVSASRGLGQVLTVDHRSDGIVVVYDSGGEREISINRVPYAGNSPAAKTAEGALAHAAMLMHPEPKDVLFIGSGTGYGPRIATLYRPRAVEVIEPAKGVLDAGRLYDRLYRGIGRESLIHFRNTDPAWALTRPAAGLDVVVLQAPPVVLTGNSRYYSVSFFSKIRTALREKGVFACRLPLNEFSESGLKNVLASFVAVFPNCAVLYPHTAFTTDVLLVAQKEKGRLMSLPRIQAALQKDALKIHFNDLDIDEGLDLINFMVMGAKNLNRFTRQAAQNTLNHPVLEFDRPDPMPNAWKKNLQRLLTVREDPLPLTDSGNEPMDPVQRNRHLAAGRVMQAIASNEMNPDVLTSELDAAKQLSPGVAGADRIKLTVMDYADRIARLRPSSMADKIQLAMAQIQVGNFEKALNLLEDELREKPDGTTALGLLGQVYLKMNRPEEAIDSLERLLRVLPEDVQAMRQIGVVHFSVGHFSEAAFWFSKAAAQSEPDAELMVQLGMALDRNDSIEEAEKAFRKAISLDPNYVRSYTGYGTMLLRQNRAIEAIRQFEKAIELNPGDKVAYGNIGMVYVNQKLFPEARKMFLKVLELDPNDAMAKRMLASLPPSGPK